MVLSRKVIKQADANSNVFMDEYNLNGIPFHNYINVKDINFHNENVIRDLNRAIILRPITKEKIIEVMVEEIQEKVICVPQIQIVDKYVEVVRPVIKYKIKEVKRPVTVEKIKKVAKIIEEEKILEVPEIQYVEKYVEVPKIVQKEKIIEIPLPMVRERRIPVLNVSKKERFQEIDAVEYKLMHPSDSIYDTSSIDMESSIYSTPMEYNGDNSQYVEQQMYHNKQEIEQYDKDRKEGSELAEMVGNQNIKFETSEKLDKETLQHIYEHFKEKESEQDSSKLRYFDSKIANYNSSEGEKQMMEQFSELSMSTNTKNDTQEQYEENKIELEYEMNKTYPNIPNLRITDEVYSCEEYQNHENNLERCEEINNEEDNKYYDYQIRKSRFESRILLSPKLESKISEKLIRKISTQMIPKSIKILEKKRKLKNENKQ